MALATTKKQKQERDSILKQIDDYAKAKNKEELDNPCKIPSNLKYPLTKKACKNLEKAQTSETDIAAKKVQTEQDKQTAALIAGATQTDTTGGATAPATPAATGGATAPATAEGDMTKYYIIGGVAIVAIGGLAFFLLRTPSSGASAPAK